MDFLALNSPHSPCTGAYPGLQLQFRQTSRRVLGFSASGYRYCRYPTAFLGKKGTEVRAPRRLVAGKSVSVHAVRQTLVLHQPSTNCYESWKSWILEEREWNHDIMVTDTSVEMKASPKNACLLAESSAAERLRKGGTLARLEGEDAKSTLYTLPYNWPKFSDAKYACVLLGSALLFLGIGLRFSTPAFAGSEASKATVTSVQETQDPQMQDKPEVETRVQKGDSLPSQESTASAPRTVENTGDLSDEFWEGIEVPKGSMEELLKSYLEKHPNNVRALEALLYTQMEKQDIPNALKILEKLVVLEPDELEWKFMQAQSHEYIGDLKLAGEGYEEILAIRPLSAKALQGMVMVMEKTGKGSDALQMIEAALARAIKENKITEARNLRMLVGQFHTLKKDLDKALEQYTLMVDEDPNDFRPYLCQGLVYSILGKNEEAEKQFKRFRKLCPRDFPDRSYIDELMLKTKKEGQKMQDSQKVPSEKTADRRKEPKPMKQPYVAGDGMEQLKASGTGLGSKQ